MIKEGERFGFDVSIARSDQSVIFGLRSITSITIPFITGWWISGKIGFGRAQQGL